jgi:glycosyltransferase involved in cell wall biosynthesis
LKIAMVVPRYHPSVAGGAELHARWLVEHLAAIGHELEVFTTAALDHYSWRNALKPGTERVDRITIHRFPTERRDHRLFGDLEHAIVAGAELSSADELAWLRNGVSSRSMEEELARRHKQFDVLLAMPYLFGTTYFAFAASQGEVALIPCLHDEPYAQLGFVRQMLSGAWGLMFNTPPEIELAKRFASQLARSTIVSLGFDPPAPADGSAFLRRHNLREPILLFVGRLEEGKNVGELVDYFITYKYRRPGQLALVLAAGSGDFVLPVRSDIIRLRIDWRERDEMYRAATIFCQPSRKESLSIVSMQAWLAERPVIVDGRGAVTRYHCEQSNGGLWFTNYLEFEAIVDRLLSDPPLRAALGRNGYEYVTSEYSWSRVMERFHQAVEKWRSSHA